MAVNKTRRQVGPVQINNVRRLIFAQRDDASVIYRHIGAINFSTEDVDHIGVLEKHFRWPFATSDTEFSLHVPHVAVAYSQRSPCTRKNASPRLIRVPRMTSKEIPTTGQELEPPPLGYSST